LPLRFNAFVKNGLKRYLAYFVFGLIAVIALLAIGQFDLYLSAKGVKILARYLPKPIIRMLPFGVSFLIFFTNVLFNVFTIMVIPIMVVKQRSLIKSLLESIFMGFRHFFQIFIIIFIPSILYVPILLAKSYPNILANRLTPEIFLVIGAVEIVAAVFVECFLLVCATQYLIQKQDIKA
jgi:hypothetical protein